MPTSTSGVSYEYIGKTEKDRTPQEKALGDGSFEAKVIVQCDWDDRFTLLNDIGASGGELYPYEPDSGAVVVAVGTEGVGATSVDGSGFHVHDTAQMTIVYRRAPNAPFLNDQVLMLEQIHPAGSMIGLPTDQLHWDSASGTGLAAAETPYVEEPMMEYIRTYYNVLVENSNTYDAKGTANEYPLSCVALNKTFAAETLRYLGGITKRRLQLGTLPRLEVTHHFLWRKYPWNKWYRAATNQYERVYHTAGGGSYITPHPLFNFNNIFAHVFS
jgi:hypothetical protein